MSWLDICWRFVEWGRDVRVDRLIAGKIDSIVDFLLLYAIILTVVFFSDLLKFHHTDIRPALYLLEKTIIVPWTSFHLFDLFLGQSMLMPWLWIDDDIGSIFEYLFSDLIIAIVVFWFLGDDPCLSEGEDCGVIFNEVISGVVIIGSWLHL